MSQHFSGQSDDLRGLTTGEAQARLSAEGANELPGHGPRGLLVITRDVLLEPMFLLLLAAASIYIVLGETREAIALSASILVVITITNRAGAAHRTCACKIA